MNYQILCRFQIESNCGLWVHHRSRHLHATLQICRRQSMVHCDEKLRRLMRPLEMERYDLDFKNKDKWKQTLKTDESWKQEPHANNPKYIYWQHKWKALHKIAWILMHKLLQNLTCQCGVVGRVQLLSMWDLQGHTEPGAAEHQRSTVEDIHKQHTSLSVRVPVWSDLPRALVLNGSSYILPHSSRTNWGTLCQNKNIICPWGFRLWILFEVFAAQTCAFFSPQDGWRKRMKGK